MEVGWVIYHKGSGLIGLINSFQSQTKLSSKKDSAYSPGMHTKGEFLDHSKKGSKEILIQEASDLANLRYLPNRTIVRDT